VLKMTWMSQNQWIWLEDFRIVVCALLPFPKKKQHEKCKNDKFKLLQPQTIYTSKPHPFIGVLKMFFTLKLMSAYEPSIQKNRKNVVNLFQKR